MSNMRNEHLSNDVTTNDQQTEIGINACIMWVSERTVQHTIKADRLSISSQHPAAFVNYEVYP